MSTLSQFLDLYPVINTNRSYKAGMMAFIDYLYGSQRKNRQSTPEEFTRYEALVERYMTESRDHVEDLMRFNAYNANIPPLTAKTRFVVVKEFFSYCGKEMDRRELRRVRGKLPKGSARTIEKDLDHDTLKKIMQHHDVKGRAFFLILVSSGMRVGELIRLRIEDFSLDESPAVVTIRGEYTKTGETRYTFLSKEAVDAVREWLKVRDKYMEAAANRNKGLVRVTRAKMRLKKDPRMFPFHQKNGTDMWTNAIKNAGFLSYDSSTGRVQIHIHMLRKFFRSQMALACPVDLVEAMMGHSGYLTDAYRRFTKKQMGEYYQRAEHLVTIQVPKELKEMETEFRTRMQNHAEIIENVVRENIQLKAEMGEIKEQMHEIQEMGKDVVHLMKVNPEALVVWASRKGDSSA